MGHEAGRDESELDWPRSGGYERLLWDLFATFAFNAVLGTASDGDEAALCAYPAFDPGEESAINGLLGHSITYRIATGPREGQKVFTLQTLPGDPERASVDVAASSGFSLHAGVAAQAAARDKLEPRAGRCAIR